MTTKKTNTKRVTYQPYLFALSFLALLSKTIISKVKGELALDYLFIMFLVVFIVSSVLYFLEFSRSKRGESKINVDIQTGEVLESEITGAEVSSDKDANVNVKTSDVGNSKIVGFRENKK